MTIQNYNQNQMQLSGMKFSMPSMQELEGLTNFCKLMATAPFYQKLGPGGVMAIYLTAQERNLPFMGCLNGGMHSVDGKIMYSGTMVGALILNAGHSYKVLYTDNRKCVIEFTRGDRKHDKTYTPFVFEYTIEEAANAGYLTKDNWKKTPKAMLWNRCMTGGARMHAPEVMLGVLVQGELVGSDADGQFECTIPDNLQQPAVEVSAPPVTPHIDYVKLEEFKVKYGIGTDSSQFDQYLNAIAKTCKKDKLELINTAMLNEEGFIVAFNKWSNNFKNDTAEVTSPKANDEELKAAE